MMRSRARRSPQRGLLQKYQFDCYSVGASPPELYWNVAGTGTYQIADVDSRRCLQMTSTSYSNMVAIKFPFHIASSVHAGFSCRLKYTELDPSGYAFMGFYGGELELMGYVWIVGEIIGNYSAINLPFPKNTWNSLTVTTDARIGVLTATADGVSASEPLSTYAFPSTYLPNRSFRFGAVGSTLLIDDVALLPIG